MQIFPIVLGQCDHTMHACMEANANWDAINDGCDVIRMLQPIRNCKVQRQTRHDEDLTLIEAIKSIYNCRQGTASNSEYYMTFKGRVVTAD